MGKIGAVLFDLDGTLVDSEPVAFKAILDICAGWGVSINPKDAAEVAGKKWEVAFDLIFDRYKFPLNKAESSRTIIEYFRKKTAENLPVIPGAVDSLRLFASLGPIGLVSGSHRQEIFFALDKLGVTDLFSIVLGAEDYVYSKPSPEGYLKALKELGVHGNEVLIFEDSSAGIESGLSAGAVLAAITSTNHFGHDQSGAHIQIKDFSDVTLEWVRAVEKRFF